MHKQFQGCRFRSTIQISPIFYKQFLKSDEICIVDPLISVYVTQLQKLTLEMGVQGLKIRQIEEDPIPIED